MPADRPPRLPQRRVRRDLVVIGIVAVGAIGVSIAFDAFDRLARWVLTHPEFEDFQIEEILTALVVLAFALAAFAWRRWRDLSSEIAASAELESDLRVANERLSEAEERYRRMVEQIPGVMYVDEPGTDMVTSYVSPQIQEILGVSERAYLEDRGLWARHLHPEDRERVLGNYRAFLENPRAERSGGAQYRFIRPDGRVVWIEDYVSVLRDREGHPTFIQGVMLDVTDRKRAEEALRASEERYRLLFETNPLPMWVYDVETLAFLAVNDAAVRQYGYSRDEFHSMTLRDIRPPEDVDRLESTMAGAEVAFQDRMTWRHCKKDGTVIDVEVTWHTLPPGDRPTGLALVLDVTERKRAEEELHRTMQQRQFLVGRLAAAHEEERLRIAADIHDDPIQKMTAVGLRLQSLRRRLDDPKQIDMLNRLDQTVENAVQRLRHLMFELRPPALDRDGLALALRMYLEDAAREAGFTFRLEKGMPSEPPVELRAVLYRIAQEALTNVRKHAHASAVEVVLEQRDGGVGVRIADDGVGIDEQAKGDRRGHAGLSLMRERANLAGGWVRFDARPGGGTMVDLWVPSEAPEHLVLPLPHVVEPRP